MAVERVPMTQVRQGDVLLTPQLGVTPDQIARIEKGGRDLLSAGTAVLAVGKGGGHPHLVLGEDIKFIETNDKSIMRQQPDDQVSRVLIVGPGGATLTHDEHEEIALPPGSLYVVFRQLETLVGDDNAPTLHQTTGIKANDRAQPSRRYVED